MDKTGLALMSPDGGLTLYSYFMDINGDVLENKWENGLWLTSGRNISETYVVTSDAAEDSPLSAISYTMNSTTYRQLFYFNSNGLVTAINTTSGSNWSEPYTVLPNATSLPNTRALAAVADTQDASLNGVRLYYGSSSGVIQELGIQFTMTLPNPIWRTFASFSNSDPSTGVACVLKNGTNHVYLRNMSTGAVQQWQWDYTDPNTAAWQIGASTPPNEDIEQGADITATTDGISTDYIFYQDTNQHTVRALYYGQNISDFVTDLVSLNRAPLGYSVAATWSVGLSEGAAVLTQNSSAPTEMLNSLITREGQDGSATIYTGP
ncbi:hypothetical protein LTR62_001354 [Meristemomyces frigidus]|uniref:Fucose-specific lectin n=1 Tax=Meristemomyces frigidus TaxID=1508187 RepID=A0AAN7YME8_9PEZI|nr:hypothetical protein LTR62_001354 [Meristemomyces frigidus]